ncbi:MULTISPECIES: hypothetical protein [Cryobacterium]|uniref:Glycosyltransferase family 1 protein n=1 Tax=Cryobacterium breve TaxID=1259258 RepID=A0ABY2IU89_9MICO|nr:MULTISPECIES: hypothetical protein [Cryobacterium]TFC94418.1 hypothetical protein E3T20_07915 [Cryobacterium sp. TmT3-12]TFC95023.1 hypothetical protein E3O65_15805 [Cryobacterium breve]
MRSLAALDAYMLPYRHGTHSGWLELCYELGVPVVAPMIGHWLDQHDEPGAVAGFDPGSIESLAATISQILPHRGNIPRGAIKAQRRARRNAERAAIATAHAHVYESALAAAALAHIGAVREAGATAPT